MGGASGCHDSGFLIRVESLIRFRRRADAPLQDEQESPVWIHTSGAAMRDGVVTQSAIRQATSCRRTDSPRKERTILARDERENSGGDHRPETTVVMTAGPCKDLVLLEY